MPATGIPPGIRSLIRRPDVYRSEPDLLMEGCHLAGSWDLPGMRTRAAGILWERMPGSLRSLVRQGMRTAEVSGRGEQGKKGGAVPGQAL